MYQQISHTRGRLAVYHALYGLLSCVNNLSEMDSSAEDSMRGYGPGGPHLANILYKHWQKPYIGTSCDLLQNTIRNYERSFTRGQYPSKTTFLVQSSGTGKSRLADEYGKICPMVTYVVRNDEHGFPPADPAIIDVMCKSPSFSASCRLGVSWDPFDEGQREKATNIWFHAISVGILQATFETCEYQTSEPSFI